MSSQDPFYPAPRDDSPLPADLARPRRSREDVGDTIGMIVGGVLLVITSGLLVSAFFLP